MIPEQLAQIRTDIENTPVSGATPEQIYACVKGGLLLLDAYGATRQWVHDLQADMYINCVYCGHRYGPNDEVPATMADALKEHIEQCPEHPMSALKRELDAVLGRERELYHVAVDLVVELVEELPDDHIAMKYIGELNEIFDKRREALSKDKEEQHDA